MINKKELGIKLRQYIEALEGHRKEYEFAKRIKISQGSLSDILNGKSWPSCPTLIKLAKFGKIKLEEMLEVG